ncbi:MAG: hypothetical protein CM15mP65_25660 [Crocinitomicaceae bacterium]|nr:MAG: hypothetical protein CM15mP65_25660 [Crocinitomicaceae bacterium]
MIKHALDLEKFGAQGITVHPRPDERHIKYDDVRALKKYFQLNSILKGTQRIVFCRFSFRNVTSSSYPGSR